MLEKSPLLSLQHPKYPRTTSPVSGTLNEHLSLPHTSSAPFVHRPSDFFFSQSNQSNLEPLVLQEPISYRKQLLIISTLVYGNFWVAACVSLQAPFFPKEAEMKGATPTQYGLVFGIYEFMILLTAPIFGKLVAKVSAVTICKLGLFIGGLSVMLFGTIDLLPPGTPFITIAYVIRIVEGIAASAFMTASYTVMAAKFPTKVATTFSYLEASFGLGLILGPTLGGALYELGGFEYPFYLLGACLFLGYFVMHFGMERDNLLGSRSTSEGSITRFVSDRSMVFDVFAIVTSLNFIGFNAATLEPHLRQFNLTPFFTGLVFIINGATYALSTPIWGKLCDRNVNPKLLIALGSLLCSLGLVFLGPISFINIQPSLPIVVISLFVVGLGMSAKLVCSFMDAINDSINRRGFKNDISTYGLVSAMFFTSCSIGASIGPSIGGFLLDTFDYRTSTIFVFAIDVFMTLYGLMFLLPHRRSSQMNQFIFF